MDSYAYQPRKEVAEQYARLPNGELFDPPKVGPILLGQALKKGILAFVGLAVFTLILMLFVSLILGALFLLVEMAIALGMGGLYLGTQKWMQEEQKRFYGF